MPEPWLGTSLAARSCLPRGLPPTSPASLALTMSLPWRSPAPWVQHLRANASGGHDIESDSPLPHDIGRVALPFTGIDAPGRALHELGVRYEADHMFELSERLSAPVMALYECSPGTVHPEGARFGSDWLCADHASLRPVEGVVAGFPCPPWSSLGARGGESDPRAACLEKLLGSLKAWSSKGLRWFVLENVQGIRWRMKGEPSTEDRLMLWFSQHMQDTSLACFGCCSPRLAHACRGVTHNGGLHMCGILGGGFRRVRRLASGG